MSTGPIGGVPRPPLVTLPDANAPRSGRPANTGASPHNAATPAPPAIATAVPMPALLPAAGTDSDTQALLDTLLDRFNQQTLVPLRLLSAQKWPMELARQVLNQPTPSPAALPEKLVRWLPMLQPWLAQQGTWQTRQGNQGFAATLYVPGSWLAQQAPIQQQPSPGVHIGTEQPQAMTSQALALALSNADGETLSALLMLEFGPARHTLPYGRDLFAPRQDPWVQQAVLLAHGPQPRVTAREAGTAHLCQDTQCPYNNRAECPQPFCPGHLPVPAIDPTR